MVVCFVGAHSCGKSTLVEFFRGKEGYVCIDSVTRSTITPEERRVDNGVSEEGQTRMYLAILDKTAEILEMNRKNPEKIYLLDRSVFDFLAYNRAFEKRGYITKDLREKIEESCDSIKKLYDVVFYLPIEFQIVPDGVRSLDETLRSEVDQEILRQIMWDKVRAVTLHGSVKERVHTVEDIIDSLKSR